MRTYLLLFLLSAGISFLLTPVLLWLACRYHWVDLPDGYRKIHAHPVPRLGGVSIFVAFNLTLLLSFIGYRVVFEDFPWHWEHVVFILLPATLIFLVGLYDDLRGLSARVKLALHVLGAALLYYNGFRIEQVALPFWSHPLSLGWLSAPVTVLWIVGVTNAFNLIDGMDGLAAGIAFFVSMASFFVALEQGKLMVCVLSIVIAGATLGFLRYNFNPARIFMGDSGSYFLGFVIGALAVRGSQKSSMVVSIVVPLLLLGLPILDTMVAIARRFLEGKPLFAPDQQHIHHRLLRLARSQRFAVIILYGAAASLGLLSWMLVVTQSQLVAVTSLTVGLAAFWGVKSLGYEEFQELGAYLSRFSEHRHTLAHQIYLRRLTDRLASTSDLAELMRIAEEALQRLNFDGAEIELSLVQPAPLRNVYSSMVPHYRWSWSPAEAAEPPVRPLMWALTIPIAGGRGAAGYLRLERSIEKGSLPARLTILIQAFVGKLSAVAATSVPWEASGLFEATSAPRDRTQPMEIHTGHGSTL